MFVTSNVGRALYIVYSFVLIPVVTILISLLCEHFFQSVRTISELEVSWKKFKFKNLWSKQRTETTPTVEERLLEEYVFQELKSIITDMESWLDKKKWNDVKHLEYLREIKSNLGIVVHEEVEKEEGEIARPDDSGMTTEA